MSIIVNALTKIYGSQKAVDTRRPLRTDRAHTVQYGQFVVLESHSFFLTDKF